MPANDVVPKNNEYTASDKMLRVVIDTAGLGLCSWDVRNNRMIWNRHVYRMLKIELSAGPVSSRTLFRYIHPDDRFAVRFSLAQLLRSGEPFKNEFRIVREDGQERWLSCSGSVFENKAGRPAGLLALLRDISAEKQAAESRHLLAEIIAESPVAIIVRDTERLVTDWNAGAERMYGYLREEMLGQKLDIMIPSDLRDEKDKILDRAMKGEHIRGLQTRRLRKDGRKIDVTVSISPLIDEAGVIYGIAGIEHDITERVVTEKVLQKDNEDLETRVEKRTAELKRLNKILKQENRQRHLNQQKLRMLREELIGIEERQRRKIAAGLHDKVIQNLVFCTIKLDQLQATFSGRNSEESIMSLQEVLAETIHELRTMTFELSPPVLYEFGLLPALEWLSEKFQEQYGIACLFENDGAEKPLSDETRNMLFQAVKELLMNVAKHAHADNVRIAAKADNSCITIEVADDGCGFDPKMITPDMEDFSSFGLFNLQERLEFIQGKFQVVSAEGQSTCISLSAPLDLCRR